MSGAIPIADLKALLQARIRELAQHLAPGGTITAGVYTAKNPTRNDRRAGSFVIWLTKAPGAWKDYATDEKGDVLDLVRYCLTMPDRKAAIEWSKQWLGLEQLTPAYISEAKKKADYRARAAKTAETNKLKNQHKQAMRWWLKCDQLVGSKGEAYLASRGIDLEALKQPPKAIRFHPALDHRPTKTRWPALVTAMTNAKGAIAAVHRTYLDDDGSGKAPVDPQRMVWPSYTGCAIRIAKGQTNMTPEKAGEAQKRDTLALTEGIEDALAIAISCPELRVWAAVSLSNLGNIEIPPCSREVIVFADNDWGKPAAEAALDRALAKLAKQGVQIKVARSRTGKDANDLYRGAS